MPLRTSTYKYYTLSLGDKWYPGYDYENMSTSENQLSALFSFVGPGVLEGWQVEALSNFRDEQISLIDGYLNNPSSDLGQRFLYLGFRPDSTCKLATTTNIASLSGLLTVDGVTLAADDRVLVKNQSTASQNGIYLAKSGAWVRASELDNRSEYNSNFIVLVLQGTNNTKTVWVMSKPPVAGVVVGTTNIYFANAFNQVVKVTPGYGIVDLYSARTYYTNYLRVTTENTFYVWAEPGLCLISDGICSISCPADPNEFYDVSNQATYLATLNTLADPTTGITSISEIVYEDRRNDLKYLAGALKNALNKAFYRHVHTGTNSTPTKILLSTTLVLDCYAPTSSTIFEVRDSTNTLFKWTSSSYGIPEVRINNIPLLSSAYRLDNTNGKLYLKNSVESGNLVQIILPLSPQSKLFTNTDATTAFTGTIYLTDGTKYTDSNNNTVYKTFSWSDTKYLPATVYLNDILVNPEYYEVDPNQGSILFSTNLPNYSSYTLSSVGVVVESVGREIEDKLTGKRIEDINAASFTRGTVDAKRLPAIDHLGQYRYKNSTYLSPSNNLISYGDSFTYYPQVNSDLQFDSFITKIYPSQNIGNLISSKNGLCVTKDYITNNFTNTWNVDNGYIKDVMDEILQTDSFDNHFVRTWALTSTGRLYSTQNKGLTWSITKQPTQANNIILANAFYASTMKEEVEQNSIIKTVYSTNLYQGTNSGFYSAHIQDGFTENEWSWSKLTRIKDENNAVTSFNVVYAVLEITTLRQVTDAQTGDVKKTYDTAIYLGTDNGFFVGSAYEVKRIYSDIVKGFYWIQSGTSNQNLNDILWHTDTEAFITHTAIYQDDGQGNTSWIPPLSNTDFFGDCRLATTTNINVTPGSCPYSIDGINLQSGNRVLVKNQTDARQNGIYYVVTLGSSNDGTWLRTADVFTAGKQVRVTAGNTNANSSWVLKYSPNYVFGSAYINWGLGKYRVYTSVNTIKGITQRKSTSQYLVYHTGGLNIVTDSFDPNINPSTSSLSWNLEGGVINHIYSITDSSTDYGILYAGTNKGLLKSTDALFDSTSLLNPWTRTQKYLYESDELTLFNSYTNIEDLSTFSVLEDYQAVKFDNAKNSWDIFTYEREYVNFYTDPWNSENADVIVYVNDIVSNIPYTTNASEGKISFLSSLLKSDKNDVTVTIIRKGAYISNTGENPHAEVLRYLVTEEQSVTKLSTDLLPTDLVMYVDNPSAIPTSTKILEIRFDTIVEKVTVDVNPVTRKITLPFARTSTITFPASSTIHLVVYKNVLGIEDLLYKKQNNLTYHLTSVDNANTLQLALASKSNYANLFSFSESPAIGNDERGLIKTLLVDSTNLSTIYDKKASNSSIYSGLLPSLTDKPFNPVSIYAVYNASKTGANMKVATDSGLWNYNGTAWVKESDLGGSSRSYYIKNIDGLISTGSDTGLWQKNVSWSQNAVYPQTQFAYLSGSWFTGTFQAYGKEDGLAFVNVASGSSTFTSDHFDLVDGKNVYGLYKDQFIRITTDSQGNSQQTKVDALYLCAEDGLYAVTNGSRSGSFASILNGREMLDNAYKTTKFYDIFRALATPPSTTAPVPMFILTSNGILKVRNWRWCDPTENDLAFTVENTFLSGISCYCYALSTEVGPPGKSKIFIGTNDGVYRSFNEGNTFEKCERILGGAVTVYALNIFSSTYTENSISVTKNVLLASTEKGMWYSADDGDTWYLSGKPTAENSYPVTFNSTINSNLSLGSTDTTGGWVAQTFKPQSGQSQVFKISAYFDLKQLQTDPAYSLSLGNQIQAYIYSTDVNGVPLTQIAASGSGTIATLISQGYLPSGFTSDSLTANSIKYPGFLSIYLPVTLPNSTSTYALVIREVVQVGGISLVQWKKSTLANPYSDGRSYSSTNGTSWAALNTADDLFFQVYFTGQSQYSETNEIVGYKSTSSINGWADGEFNGLIVNDSGALTTDFKFATSFLIDDTTSMGFAFDNISNYENELSGLVDRIWNRTTISSLPLSYADVWVYGNSILQKTLTGFINDSVIIKSYISALKQKGNQSTQNEAIDIAITTLSPQGIAESILKSNDIVGNLSRTNTIINYLTSISSLRFNELKSWYSISSNAQVNLIPLSSANITQPNIGLSKDGITLYKWIEFSYLYIEVSVNNVVVNSGYTINPYNGQITFSPALSLGDTVSVVLRQDWDGTQANIASSNILSTELIRRWSESYLPLSFVFTDGKNISVNTALEIIENSATAWNDAGVNINAFLLGKNTTHSDLLKIGQSGKFFHIGTDANSSDFDNAFDSLMHGNLNTIFAGNWTKTIDYNEPKYITSVFTNYSAPTSTVNSSCIVKFRWTSNRTNYSSWITLTSNTAFVLNKDVLAIQYSVEMKDGWNGTTRVRPAITELYHTIINPAIEYHITNSNTIDGSLFEYIHSHDKGNLAAKFEWGICRGDSTDWSDFYTIKSGRNGVMPNRQSSILYTDPLSRSDLKTTTTDYFIYQVYESSGSTASWTDTDDVTIYINGLGVGKNSNYYSLDSANGLIYFTSEKPVTAIITVDIVTPESAVNYNGETTSTIDNRTYYLANGRWPSDSSVVVLVNGSIVRGGYFTNREMGTVTFTKELNFTDIVTVFVLPSNKFRVGVKISKYTNSTVDYQKFGLTYTSVANKEVELDFLSSPSPTIYPDSLSLLPSPAISTERIYIDYDFVSEENNKELNSRTEWYRRRGGGSFLRVNASNSLPNYDNRTVEKLSDINSLFIENDQVKVIVYPSDGLTEGVSYESLPVTIGGNKKPYVKSLTITGAGKVITSGVNYISPNVELKAKYIFNDGETGSSDITIEGIDSTSIINWYVNDSKTSIYTGSILPSKYVSSGIVISYRITPYDGTLYGTLVQSEDITVY